jgi:hypothetical protein
MLPCRDLRRRSSWQSSGPCCRTHLPTLPAFDRHAPSRRFASETPSRYAGLVLGIADSFTPKGRVFAKAGDLMPGESLFERLPRWIQPAGYRELMIRHARTVPSTPTRAPLKDSAASVSVVHWRHLRCRILELTKADRLKASGLNPMMDSQPRCNHESEHVVSGAHDHRDDATAPSKGRSGSSAAPGAHRSVLGYRCVERLTQPGANPGPLRCHRPALRGVAGTRNPPSPASRTARPLHRSP